MGHSITIENYDFPEGIVSLEITTNLSDMYYLAAKNAGYEISHFGEFLHGKKMSELQPFLLAMRTELEKNKKLYIPLNPSNGWGSYDGLLKNINRLIAASYEVPDNKLDDWY